MERQIFTLVSLLTMIIWVNADFYDIFQNLQPFLKNQQTSRPDYSFFGNSRESEERKRYDDTQTYTQTRDRTTSKPKRKNTSQIYNIEYLTTQKPRRSKNNSSPRNDINKNKLTNNNSNRNINNDYHTQKPTTRKVTTTTSKPRYYNQNFNSYTTRPGVRPALVDTNRPPITNRPPTTRPTTNRPLAVYPKPTDSSVIRFPEDDDSSPEVLVGKDEDTMSNVEKRRYIELAEKMCDKYKSLNVKKVEAIPLLPSPEPVQVNVSVCPPSKVPLVVGGKVVSIEEFPHMALLGWTYVQKPGYSWKCGGSLISDQFVLTAGHCAYQEKDDSVVYGAPRAAQLGSSYMDDTGALVVKVLHVVRHPKYIRPTSYYDIALVKLVKPVTFSQVVKPACLGVPPGVGEPIIATGWGRTEYGGTQSLELRSVSIPIWDMDECKQVLGVSRKMPDGPSRDSQICAGERGKDTCQGDSGGPAQVQDGCAWRIVAVTSVGRSCGAPNTPAIYATLHRAFIAAEIFGKTANQQTDFNSSPNNSPNRNNNGQGNNNNNSPNRNNNGQNTNNNNSQGAWNGNTNGNRNNNAGIWNNNQQNSNNNRNGNRPSTNVNVNTNNNRPNTNVNVNTNSNWNNGQQNTNNNGNWNNSPNVNSQQTNRHENANNNKNNYNSGQENTNYDKNSNNNRNDNSQSAFQSSNVNNNRPANYNINTNIPQNYNSNSNYYKEPEITIPYENNRSPLYYNNNNDRKDEFVDYYDSVKYTTKRPSYNNDWFNYGF